MGDSNKFNIGAKAAKNAGSTSLPDKGRLLSPRDTGLDVLDQEEAYEEDIAELEKENALPRLIQNAGGLVDGLFSDEDNYMHQDWRWNQSDDQMALHQYEERFTYQTMLDTLIENGFWFWSAFNGEHHNDVVPGNNNNSGWGGQYFDATYCSNWMRARCNTEWTRTHVMAVQLDVPNINESIASFLVVRGPVAYIGFGAGYHPQTWRPEFFYDVGEPTGNCSETSPGVFERNWTYGTAHMDCNTYKAGPIPHNPARNNSW